MDSLAGSFAEVEEQLAAAVDVVFAAGVRAASDEDVCGLAAAAGQMLRRVEGLLVEVAGEIAERSSSPGLAGRLTTRQGCRSVADLLAHATLLSGRRLAEVVKASRPVREEIAVSSGELLPAEFPALREALVDGVVGVDAVLAVTDPLRRVTMNAGREAMLAADAELAGAARGAEQPAVSADLLKQQACVWSVVLDPDGTSPSERNGLRKRGVVFRPEKDGIVPISGGLLPEVAAQFRLLSHSILNPRVDDQSLEGPWFTDTDPRDADGNGGSDRADGFPVTDERTFAQKQHDVLATILTKAASSGGFPTVAGAPPVLVITAREADLKNGADAAHIDGVEGPVSLSVARQIGCAGMVQRVEMDVNGKITSMRIFERVFNPHQRRAIGVRDGTCLIPGCGVPASWCEVHHVTEHAKGGETDTCNGVLLCWMHHRTIDNGVWAIRMRDGVPELRGPGWWDPYLRWRPVTKSRTRLHDRFARQRT